MKRALRAARGAAAKAGQAGKLAGTVGIAMVLLVVSASFGARLPGFGFLSSFPSLRSLDYGADHIRRLTPLSDRFLAEALGDSTYVQLFQGDESVAGVPTPRAPAPPGNDFEDRDSGGDVRHIFSDWDLQVTLSADKSAARPGDHITYTMIVRNIGKADYPGTPPFDLYAHFPYHTTSDLEGHCANGQYEDPANGCFGVPAPVQGSQDGAVHQEHENVGAPISPGKSRAFTFGVTVDPGTPAGTVLSNHAHVEIVGRAAARSDNVDVIVQ